MFKPNYLLCLGDMYYLSDIISDLASLFPFIKLMEDRYMDYGLAIDYNILVTELGVKVAIVPYDANYTRAEQN